MALPLFFPPTAAAFKKKRKKILPILFVLADKALKGRGLGIFEQMTEHISCALYADIGPLCH